MYPVPHSQCFANSFSFKRARKTKQEIKTLAVLRVWKRSNCRAFFASFRSKGKKADFSADALVKTNLSNVTILVNRRFFITSLPLSPILNCAGNNPLLCCFLIRHSSTLILWKFTVCASFTFVLLTKKVTLVMKSMESRKRTPEKMMKSGWPRKHHQLRHDHAPGACGM